MSAPEAQGGEPMTATALSERRARVTGYHWSRYCSPPAATARCSRARIPSTRAQRIQNALYLPDAPRAAGASMPTASAAILAYTDARKNLRQALDKHRKDLDADGLTGPALVLLALTEVQLDALAGSLRRYRPCTDQDHRACAKQAAGEADDKIKNQPPLFRDQFLLALIPGLLDHNQGLRLTALQPHSRARRAGNSLRHGTTSSSPDEGWRAACPADDRERPPAAACIYGRMVQIQIVKAWVAALEMASNPSSPTPRNALRGLSGTLASASCSARNLPRSWTHSRRVRATTSRWMERRFLAGKTARSTIFLRSQRAARNARGCHDYQPKLHQPELGRVPSKGLFISRIARA